ncbi:MAG TPA: helix-turn-helix domain-containing protein [Longimicrobium sp.]
MQLSTLDEDWARVADAVPRLRRASPASPLVLWARAAGPDDFVELGRDAAALGVRAVLAGPEPDPAVLRRQLTDPVGLETDVLRWALDAGLLASPRAEAEVRVVMEIAMRHRTLASATARHADVADRTWRHHFQRLLLPPPRAWLNMARALRVALHLQRNCARPLQPLALALGYSDVTVLSNQLVRIFALRPGEIRRLLGFEPLVFNWFRNAALAAAGRRAPSSTEPPRHPRGRGAPPAR